MIPFNESHHPMSSLLLTAGQRDLVMRLARGDRPFDISCRIGEHHFRQLYDGASAKLGVRGKGEAALVHAAYKARVLDLPEHRQRTDLRLSPEERLLLDFMTDGADVETMAYSTGWSLAEVRRAARRLLAKLGVRTPWHAISRAWQLRLLTHSRPAQPPVPHGKAQQTDVEGGLCAKR